MFCSTDAAYAEPIVYNLKVAGSLAKQVYIAEKLAPPTSVSQITSAYRQIWECVSKPSYWMNSLPSGEWKKVAVYGVEAIGIFSIGEIVRVVHVAATDTDWQAQHRWLQHQDQRQGPRPPLNSVLHLSLIHI